MRDYDDARDVVLDRAFETPDLDYLLKASAGMKDDAPFYRPYIVAAIIWRTAPNRKRVQKTRNLSFDDVQETIAGLMAQQAMEDMGVTVPAGYVAVSSGAVPGPVFTGWQ